LFNPSDHDMIESVIILLVLTNRPKKNSYIMTLSNADKKRFRSIGHELSPIVTIAQKGVTENIKTEIERALKQHELIKIKLITTTREEKKSLAESLCQEFSAECIQSIGHMILVYRPTKMPDPRLSNIKRSKK
jgi:RNA-binding protein